MKQKWIALLLALALAASVCGISAAADENAGTTTDKTTISPAGPDNGGLLAEVTIVPDAVGTLSFENLEHRMRENCLDVVSRQARSDSLEEVDYEDAEEDLRKALNGIAGGQWELASYGMTGSGTYVATQQQYAALREQYEAIRDGDLQEENEALIRQLRAGQDQIVLVGESTYITLVELEIQEDALQRQLEALNRTVEEMELRYGMGQISAMQLTEVKTGRASLVSGLETLRMNIKNIKTQMELLLGAELTGEIQLSPVPAVTEQQMAAMDVERDLEAAKEKSYTLYAAARTLEDAEDTYLTDARKYAFDPNKTEYRTVLRTWEAAQYAYNNAVQAFELSFRQLHAQVLNCGQLLEAAKTSLESEKLAYEAAGLKYQQGTLSQNAYLTARDDLEAAEEAVQTAANDLFSAYNTYCWAVERGILN